MQILVFRGEGGTTNLGDELNDPLFGQLLPPQHMELYPETLFVGIGTHLHSKLPKMPHTVVFGAGAGYGELPTPEQMASWRVYCVRGPLTAGALELSPETAILDPAYLVSLFVEKQPPRYEASFMPHWLEIQSDPSLVGDYYEKGIHVIDPRWPVRECLRDIAGSKVVFASALHGAVVADALRIPWVAVKGAEAHELKWLDWTKSVKLDYSPETEIKVNPTKVLLSSDITFSKELNRLKTKLVELQQDIIQGKV